MGETLLITRDFDLSECLTAARGLDACGTPAEISDYAAELYCEDENGQCRKKLEVAHLPEIILHLSGQEIEIEHDDTLPINWPWSPTLDPQIFYFVRWGPLQYVWTVHTFAKKVEIPEGVEFTPPEEAKQEWKTLRGGRIIVPADFEEE